MKIKIEIKHWMTGAVLFEYEKEENTIKNTVVEANLRGADLRGADLYGADLRETNLYGADLREANLYGAEMQNVKFYGKGGTTKIKKSQLEDFLKTLGVIMED